MEQRPALVLVSGPNAKRKARAIASDERITYIELPTILQDKPWHIRVEEEEPTTVKTQSLFKFRDITAYYGRWCLFLMALEQVTDSEKIYVIAPKVFDPDTQRIDAEVRDLLTPMMRDVRRRHRISYVWMSTRDREERRSLSVVDRPDEGVFYNSVDDSTGQLRVDIFNYFGLPPKAQYYLLGDAVSIAKSAGAETAWLEGKESIDPSLLLTAHELLKQAGVDLVEEDDLTPSSDLGDPYGAQDDGLEGYVGKEMWMDPDFMPDSAVLPHPHNLDENNNDCDP